MPGDSRASGVRAPARLSVLLARDAPAGVVVRRGRPRGWARISLWHTDTDEIEDGQWFHGVLDGYDVSPDGRLFIYQAIKYHWERHKEPESLHRWTAISKPPYLTALALWANWSGGWAGGMFAGNHKIEFPTGIRPAWPDVGRLPKSMSLERIDDTIFSETMLKRKGWELVQKRVWQFPPGRLVRPAVWHKPSPGQGPVRFTIVRAVRWPKPDRYSLRSTADECELSFAEATWVDWDHSGRLVYAEKGRLLALAVEDLSAGPRVIADFNDQEFVEMTAPDWARSW